MQSFDDQEEGGNGDAQEDESMFYNGSRMGFYADSGQRRDRD